MVTTPHNCQSSDRILLTCSVGRVATRICGLHRIRRSRGHAPSGTNLRITAQEAALRESANGKLQRPLAHYQSFERAEVEVGEPALFYETAGRKSAPRRRCPAVVLDFGGTGVAVEVHGQTSKVARFCAGTSKVAQPEDLGDVEWNPASDRSGGVEVWPSPSLGASRVLIRHIRRRRAALAS